MSAHIFAITVIMEEPITDEHADDLVNAIKLLHGVADATKLTVKPEVYYGKENARRELIEKLWEVLK